MSRVRRYCYTYNNYDTKGMDVINSIECRYMIYGKEIGESGTPHLQGYVEMNKAIELKTMVKRYPGIHWIVCNGTQAENIKYCSKGGDIVEMGDKCEPGKRMDIHSMVSEMKKGKRITDIVEDTTYAVNLQTLVMYEKLQPLYAPKRNWATEVIWLYGKSGSGKSRLARQWTNPNDLYVKSSGSKWWCGYEQQSDIILDDFRPEWMAFSDLLTLLDRYECRVEVKGGSRQILARKIIITSHKAPELMYCNLKEDYEQLKRRITCWRDFDLKPCTEDECTEVTR